MELVEGPTLAELIASRASGSRLQASGSGRQASGLPLDEALPIAKQIAEALEAAHEQGIIHRDLKPANVKVRPDGTVKVLDFGLAKLVEAGQAGGAGGAGGLSQSPTITSPALMTGVGMLLGTAAYMSPEQAKGRPADKRSDVWAFGCVLYEMLAGKRAFAGEDVSDTLASVLRAEPDWSALPAETPTGIRRMLRRCLTKDPRERLRDIADARLDLRDAPTETGDGAVPLPGRRHVVAWSIAAALGVLSASLAILLLARSRPISGNDSIYQSVILPLRQDGGSGEEAPIANIRRGLALSPDGRRLAFIAPGSDGRPLLWIQSLDASTAEPLRGIEDATTAINPTWSPDGRHLAFVADYTLYRSDAGGGPPMELHQGVARLYSSPAWNRDNVILFTGPGSDGRLCILQIPAAGGAASAVTSLGDEEISHAQPHFLPDGNRFLFRVNGSSDVAGIHVGFLDTGEHARLIPGNASLPAYASGFLLFVRETTLMAQAFDVERQTLSGEAIPLAPSIRTGGAPSAGGSFSVSETGVLVYQEDTAQTSQLVWVDRSGRQTARLSDPGDFGYIQLSPADDRVAVSVTDAEGYRDVWLYDATRGVPTRLTSDPVDEFSAAWSPDGRTLVMASARLHAEQGVSENWGLGLYEKSTTGTTTREALLVPIPEHEIPTSWSADGRFLLYQTQAATADLWVLPLAGDRKPIPFIVDTPFSEQYAQFSPDGRWIAYSSNETGRTEIYVAAFQHAGGTVRISTAGGGSPKWRRDGKEIFYIGSENTLMAVAVRESGSKLEFSDPQPLFQTEFDNSPLPYAVTGDGQRFLVNRSSGRAQPPIALVVNWPALLRQRPPRFQP
jgi:Tol biopolymer transport system component